MSGPSSPPPSTHPYTRTTTGPTATGPGIRSPGGGDTEPRDMGVRGAFHLLLMCLSPGMGLGSRQGCPHARWQRKGHQRACGGAWQFLGCPGREWPTFALLPPGLDLAKGPLPRRVAGLEFGAEVLDGPSRWGSHMHAPAVTEYRAVETGSGVHGQVSSKAGWGLRRSLGRSLFTSVCVYPAGGPPPQARARAGSCLQRAEPQRMRPEWLLPALPATALTGGLHSGPCVVRVPG